MIKLLILSETDEGKLTEWFLRIAGLQFTRTTDKDIALNILHNETIDILIMSHFISDSYSCLDFYHDLKATWRFKNIGLIVLSTSSLFRSIGGKDLGKGIRPKDSYLPPPFLIDDLIITIRKVLNNYGKEFPSAEERRIQFKIGSDVLQRELNWSDEKVELVLQNMSDDDYKPREKNKG